MVSSTTSYNILKTTLTRNEAMHNAAFEWNGIEIEKV